MNLSAYYDDRNGVVRMKIPSDTHFDEKASPLFMKELGKLFEGKRYHYLLCDVSESSNTPPSRKVRRWMTEEAAKIGLDRIAIVGSNNVTRMIARIMFAAIGKSSSTQFFVNETSALEWLKRKEGLHG